MLKRFIPALTIWALILGCWFALNHASVGASQDMPTAAAPKAAPRPSLQSAQAVPVVVQQMQALERRAKVDMLLYAGAFGQSHLAEAKKELPAIALNLKARPGRK